MPALIFDCDGVLMDTERFGHLPAFNQAFAGFNLPVHWSEKEYGVRLRIAGGKERIGSILTPGILRDACLPDDPQAQKELVARLHKAKTEIYRKMILSGRLPPRPGVARIVREALGAGWQLAVASTSAEESVRAVLETVVTAEIAQHFLVLAGDIVAAKKPSPDIYILALEKLHVAADEALIIEDSQNGVAAATAAGVRCIVTLSSYTAREDMKGALLVISDLGEPTAPLRVISNHSQARPGACMTLGDLRDCLR
jgi:HAD superfamily hydrolase (TIGR01509 family)